MDSIPQHVLEQWRVNMMWLVAEEVWEVGIGSFLVAGSFSTQTIWLQRFQQQLKLSVSNLVLLQVMQWMELQR